MAVVHYFSLRRMLVSVEIVAPCACPCASQCYPPLPLLCADAGSMTASRSGPTAVGEKHQVSCGRRRPHTSLTSACPRAHRSDARSPGRSRSSAVFVVIALGHVHLLQRFDACADRRGHAAWCCMYQRPGLRAGPLYLVHGGSAASICCTKACTLVAALVSPHARVGVSFCDLNIVCASGAMSCMHL